MKKIWQSHKKLIVGVMALVLVGSIVIGQVLTNETEAEAAGILYDMNSRLAMYGSEFNILEIVPSYSQSDYTYDEMGVFVGTGQNNMDPAAVMKSKYFARTFRNITNNTLLDRLLELRMYGLIKQSGRDNGAADDTSDNPIYMTLNGAITGAFEKVSGNVQMHSVIPEEYLFIRGYYVEAAGGNYELESGYYIGADGFIYKTANGSDSGDTGAKPEEPVSDDDSQDEEDTDTEDTQDTDDEEDSNTDDSVSANSFTQTVQTEGVEEITLTDEQLESDTPQQAEEEENDNTNNGENATGGYTVNYLPDSVSDNGIPVKVASDLSAYYYVNGKGGADGNTKYCPLPEGIKYVGNGAGTIDFKPDETNGIYWGYDGTTWQYVSSNGQFYNGDWFKTYVFGNRNIKFSGQNVNINISTKPANTVTAADIDKADLVYLSGTDEGYTKAGVDITKEVLEALFNATVVNHKAVIMDYDIVPNTENSSDTDTTTDYRVTTASSNLQKLAALLWQSDQKAVADNFTSLFDANETLGSGTGTEEADTNPDYGKILDIDGILSNDSLFTYLWDNRIKEGYKGNFVTGNLYVYDHYMDLFENPQSMVDAHDFFANGDFNSEYKESVYNVAFSNVYAYIQNNNTSYSDYAVSDAVTPALIIQYILCSDGTSGSLVKSNLSVLEIQPCTTFLYNSNNFESLEYTFASTTVKKNRDEFIKKYINPDLVTSNKQGYVSFTSMSINEFVCKNENILEQYDLIYIGSEDDDYYHANASSTSLTDWKTVTASIPDFDDYTNMEGMVYYNIGDILKANAAKTDNANWKILFTAGFLSGEAQTVTEAVNNSSKSKTNLRYAGRDLTSNKLEELETYLAAGHPVVVAGDLMCKNANKIKTVNPTRYTGTNTSGIKWDHGRIDNSSNMYEFFMYALGYEYTVSADGSKASYEPSADSAPYANFFSERDVTGPEEISTYLNAQQLYLELSAQPEEYEYTLMDNGVIDTDTVRYLQADADDGGYYLDYEFTISNSTSTTSNTSMSYTTKLFVDVNSDGKFSVDEECDDAIITYAATGEEAPKSEVIDQSDQSTSDVYDLEPGVSYKLRRTVPQNYSGVIAWCLRVQNINDSRFQANKTGYTCVKAEKKAEIRILQINNNDRTSTVGSWAKSYLNLQSQMASTTSEFGKYLNNLADYTVVVKTLTITQFENNYKQYYNAQKALGVTDPDPMNYFDNFEFSENTKGVNMIVLGFGDDFAPFSDDSSIQAVKSFIDSGRAVLLCHDFMMMSSSDKQVRTLRDAVGMDKYDVTGDIDALKTGNGTTVYNRSDRSDRTKINAIESNSKKKAVAYLPGSTRNSLVTTTQGYSDFLVNWGYSGWTNSKHLYANAGCVSVGWQAANYYVDQMNEGQLTEYPYNIATSFKVSTTHGQYYQLDLESDSDNDGNGDMTVWYTLSYLNKRGDKSSSSERFNATAGDGSNMYYIYNKGNVTYTGAGHSTINQEEEIRLFVNTLLAAYTAVDVAPTVDVYETPSQISNTLKNIAIPYDSTITNPMDDFGNKVNGLGQNITDASGNKIQGSSTVDSSIQYNKDKGDYDYKFVDPNTDSTVAESDKTAVYFKATDANFKKGTKRMSLTFYMQVDPDDILHTRRVTLGANASADAYKDADSKGVEYLLDNGTWTSVLVKSIEGQSVTVVEIPIDVYESDLSNKLVSKETTDTAGNAASSQVQSGQMYAFYLPLYYLRYESSVSIYIEAQTYINNVSTSGAVTAEINPALGYTKLDITKVDLLKLD